MTNELLNTINPDDYVGDVTTLINRLKLHDITLATVVRAINDVDEWRFTTADVSENVSLSKTTVRRKLKSLEEHGFLLGDRSSKATTWKKHIMFDLPDGYYRNTEVRLRH